MTFNSEQIIQEIRQEFEDMLDYVTNEAAYLATADQMERGLFTQLLKLGWRLLLLFFTLRSQQSSRETFTTPKGISLPYHRDTKRDYVSIFGKLPIWRPYFYKTGMGSACPLDAALSLGEDSYSDMLRELSTYLGVNGVYHKVCAILADGKGVPLIVEAETPPPLRLGKGQKRGHKKEAIVTTAYTIAPTPRTPEAVLASYYKLSTATEKRGIDHPAPQNKHVWATLDGKDTALERLVQHIRTREGSHIQQRVALCDGCEALQTRIASYFPDYVQILDFIHANEYLWDVATVLLGEDDQKRLPWMIQHTRQLLAEEKTCAIIAEFRDLAAQSTTKACQREQLTKTANYFERNLPYMDYAAYLAHGWPIASGVIEGACRHFVKDRCELSGMRWSLQGADCLLRLRAVAENDDWEAYHTYRKRQRHERLYNQPYPQLASAELLALTPETLAIAA
jgi:hypothetical protein